MKQQRTQAQTHTKQGNTHTFDEHFSIISNLDFQPRDRLPNGPILCGSWKVEARRATVLFDRSIDEKKESKEDEIFACSLSFLTLSLLISFFRSLLHSQLSAILPLPIYLFFTLSLILTHKYSLLSLSLRLSVCLSISIHTHTHTHTHTLSLSPSPPPFPTSLCP